MMRVGKADLDEYFERLKVGAFGFEQFCESKVASFLGGFSGFEGEHRFVALSELREIEEMVRPRRILSESGNKVGRTKEEGGIGKGERRSGFRVGRGSGEGMRRGRGRRRDFDRVRRGLEVRRLVRVDAGRVGGVVGRSGEGVGVVGRTEIERETAGEGARGRARGGADGTQGNGRGGVTGGKGGSA